MFPSLLIVLGFSVCNSRVLTVVARVVNMGTGVGSVPRGRVRRRLAKSLTFWYSPQKSSDSHAPNDALGMLTMATHVSGGGYITRLQYLSIWNMCRINN